MTPAVETAPAALQRARRTPLDAWIAGRVGCDGGRVDAGALDAWQLARLRETVARARTQSAFYARHLTAHNADGLRTLDDLRELPFTTADHLRSEGQRMLCVRPDAIERIVTLPTSGTTGSPKRVFFTGADLELTVDFFHHGMSTLTVAGDRVLVLMPGERPGSVGELLARALPRLGAQVLVHGPVRGVEAAWSALTELKATVVVGIPTQVLTLALYSAARGAASWTPRAVLLSADRTSPAVRGAIERAWSCRVFDHYGATEMGFGGGVECEAHTGFHLRAADLLFEVVSPVTSLPVPPGEAGEVVFTTLTRVGMPLVRYRTGDLGSMVAGTCPCGSTLPRLAAIEGRLAEAVVLADGGALSIGMLDDCLLDLDGVADLQAAVDRVDGVDRLRIELRAAGSTEGLAARARRALLGVPALARASGDGRLLIEVGVGDAATWPCTTGMTKRLLRDERGREDTDA